MPRRKRMQEAKRAARRADREQYARSWWRIELAGVQVQTEDAWDEHLHGGCLCEYD